MALKNVTLSPEEDFLAAHKDAMYQTRTAIPGIIDSVNMDGTSLKNVNVQIAINAFVTDSDNYTVTAQEYPVIPNVPVVMPRSANAGYSVNIPVTKGDSVLLVFGDRSIDNWQSTGSVAAPAEQIMPRLHDITDAIAIVGLGADTQPIPNFNNDAIEIRTPENNVYASFSENEIVLRRGNQRLTINSNETKIDGKLTVTGTVDVQNNLEVTGGGNLTVGGVNMRTHVHLYGNNEETGGPQAP